MKKTFIFISFLLSVVSYSQVGIGTDDPKATLDVVAGKKDGSTAEGIIAPRMTGDEIKSANSQYGTDQTGAIVYATAAISSDDSTGKTSNITLPNYYYFDGTVWVALKTPNTSSSDATRFVGGTIYVIKGGGDDNSGTLTDTTKLIGGAAGTSYTIGNTSLTSRKGSINYIRGNGFTISSPSRGLYDIKFDVPFSNIYGVSSNIYDAYGNRQSVPDNVAPITPDSSSTSQNPGIGLVSTDNTQIGFINNSWLRIKCGDNSGALSNRSFTFTVIGQ